MKKEAIRLDGIKKHYGTKLALDIPSLSIEEGKVLAIVGPNGCGKTTMLEVAALLQKPSEGKVLIWGEEATGTEAVRRRLRKELTLVDQSPFLFDKSVFGNLAFGLRIRGLSSREIRARSEKVLEQVGLRGFGERQAATLSAGEAQRITLARAMILRPKILFLDEPTASVDLFHVQVVESLIREIHEREGTTIVFTTHSLAQSYKLASDLLLLVNGQLSPASPENHFSGAVHEWKGEPSVKLATGMQIIIPEKREGVAHFTIPPEDVLLSKKGISSSARNSYRGRVVKLSEDGDRVQVTVDVGVEVVAAITKRSLNEMGIKIGDSIHLTFKVLSVHVY